MLNKESFIPILNKDIWITIFKRHQNHTNKPNIGDPSFFPPSSFLPPSSILPPPSSLLLLRPPPLTSPPGWGTPPNKRFPSLGIQNFLSIPSSCFTKWAQPSFNLLKQWNSGKSTHNRPLEGREGWGPVKSKNINRECCSKGKSCRSRLKFCSEGSPPLRDTTSFIWCTSSRTVLPGLVLPPRCPVASTRGPRQPVHFWRRPGPWKLPVPVCNAQSSDVTPWTPIVQMSLSLGKSFLTSQPASSPLNCLSHHVSPSQHLSQPPFTFLRGSRMNSCLLQEIRRSKGTPRCSHWPLLLDPSPEQAQRGGSQAAAKDRRSTLQEAHSMQGWPSPNRMKHEIRTKSAPDKQDPFPGSPCSAQVFTFHAEFSQPYTWVKLSGAAVLSRETLCNRVQGSLPRPSRKLPHH